MNYFQSFTGSFTQNFAQYFEREGKSEERQCAKRNCQQIQIENRSVTIFPELNAFIQLNNLLSVSECQKVLSHFIIVVCVCVFVFFHSAQKQATAWIFLFFLFCEYLKLHRPICVRRFWFRQTNHAIKDSPTLIL